MDPIHKQTPEQEAQWQEILRTREAMRAESARANKKTLADWWREYSAEIEIWGNENKLANELKSLLQTNAYHWYVRGKEDDIGIWDIYGAMDTNELFVTLNRPGIESFCNPDKIEFVAKCKSHSYVPPMVERAGVIDELDLEWCQHLRKMIYEVAVNNKTKEQVLTEWAADLPPQLESD